MELGQDLVLVNSTKFRLLGEHRAVDFFQQRFGLDAKIFAGLFVEFEQAPDRGHPDPEKFIQIGREDGQEFEAIIQR